MVECKWFKVKYNIYLNYTYNLIHIIFNICLSGVADICE